jgi:UDP:flavonoid glycosyltransferase YjiC (YdhE family)
VRIVATSFGSAGDFLPTLSVARALHDAGHDVVFLSNPFHEPQARAAGLPFVSAGDRVDVFHEIESKPIYLDAVRGGKALWNDFARPFIGDTYRALKQLVADRRPDVVVGSNLAFGVFWAAAEAEIPRVMIAATPLSWLSRRAPMQFTDGGTPDWLLPTVRDRKSVV